MTDPRPQTPDPRSLTPAPRPPIKVLIVEDSKVVQEFLVHILTSNPAIQVVGIAENGEEAIEAAAKKRPDVITMDVHMPKVDGFEATRTIMETAPTPIVIVTGSLRTKELALTFRALEAGALAVVLRPPGIGHPEHEAAVRELIQTVKLMSEIKVVRRHPVAKERALPPTARIEIRKTAAEIQAVAIGASTGGPPVLQQILSGLPQDFPVPVLIVQHISAGFTKGFVEWLSDTTRFPVCIASHGEYPLPGQGYVAPDGFHLGIGNGPRIVLSDHAPENGLRPSVAYLFRSVAQTLGPNAVGVLLTGMGRDGAVELKEMKDKGAVTIVQDKESSVVHGMPGEAVALNAHAYVLPPDKIATLLGTLTGKRSNSKTKVEWRKP
ncbi:MAG TPA: chemotaxis-specific protein-glutamate methyltransferase CheB [Syntrophales bacterium]|nr:chemotaxis-specific protein-glutamate methyltransferase CheB [Syntrophales bacterium]